MTSSKSEGGAASAPEVPRGWWRAVRTGLRGRCPACGEGRLYHSYLKVTTACDRCGEDLHHQRADDAPPYITIFLVGHIVVPLVLMLERAASPPTWVHAALWLPLSLGLALTILPAAKGALVGLQWALRMHGFGGAEDGVAAPPGPRAAG